MAKYRKRPDTKGWHSINKAGVIDFNIMDKMINNCTKGEQKTTLMVTAPEIWLQIYNLMEKYLLKQKLDKIYRGIEFLFFKGIPIITHSKCPSGIIYFINDNYFNESMQEFLTLNAKQPLSIYQIISREEIIHKWIDLWFLGEIKCINSDMQGIIKE